jgi:hypothetical protein
MCSILYELQHYHLKEQTGIMKTYPHECYGHKLPTKEELIKFKNDKFFEFKTNKPSKEEYDNYFLKYIPPAKTHNTYNDTAEEAEDAEEKNWNWNTIINKDKDNETNDANDDTNDDTSTNVINSSDDNIDSNNADNSIDNNNIVVSNKRVTKKWYGKKGKKFKKTTRKNSGNLFRGIKSILQL